MSHVIVLFDFIEESRAHGAPMREALLDAGLVRLRPVLVSATSDAGLRAQAQRLRAHMAQHPEDSLHDQAYSLATTRSMFETRAVLVADGPERCLALLDKLEGHPRFYRRVPMLLPGGPRVETYVLPPDRVDGCTVIASGSWRAHRKERVA